MISSTCWFSVGCLCASCWLAISPLKKATELCSILLDFGGINDSCETDIEASSGELFIPFLIAIHRQFILPLMFAVEFLRFT